MKKVLWGVGMVVVGAGLFALGWISHGVVGKASATSASTSDGTVASEVSNNPGANRPPQAAPAPFISQGDFQHLRSVRDAVMQANPDLAAEYKQILKDMQAEQDDLDAAMVKADPKIAPLIAKLVAMRQHNGAHAPSVGAGPR